MELINTLGRRKEAVARVYVKDGKGEIKINDRKFEEYFPEERLQILVKQPLVALDFVDKFDINVNVSGGGIKGQAEAVRMGIARAIVSYNEENKSAMRKGGFLTRDSRVVERKKPGQKKARKRFQFSKR